MVEHNWLLYTAAFACAFAITLVATPFAKWLSIKWGAIDYPKDRGVHKKAMPRMGGIAIVLGFVLTVLMVYHYDKSMNGRQLAGFLTGALLIAGLGMLDDIKNLPAKLKFCVQILAALIVIFSGVRIQVVLWPVTAALQKFSVPITLVWIVGLTNAVNLIDGLDGLAGGISAIILVVIACLSVIEGRLDIQTMSLILAGATMGFLLYNSHPASIFMGDCGALFLGFIISAISLLGFKSSTIMTLALPILLLAVPIVDTIGAILRRKLSGHKFSEADKKIGRASCRERVCLYV